MVLNSYVDGSGEDMNALAFDKSEMKIRHYFADQAATSWGTPKTLAYVEDFVPKTGGTFTGPLSVQGNILLTGPGTTTDAGRMIDFTGFDKEGTTDFSDRAYIQHTVNAAGHAGSVLVISSQNDADDGVGFITSPSSQIKHNGHVMWDAGNDGSGSDLDADKLDGLHLNSTITNSEVNKVMRTDGNGYANFGWINTTSGDTTNASTDYYVNTNDGYIRKKTLANVRAELVTSAAVIAGLGYTPARVQGRVVNDMDHADFRVSGMYGINGSPTNGYGESYGALIVANNSDTGLQIAGGHSNDDLYFRGWSDGGSTYTAWRRVWHAGNLTNLNQLTNGPGYLTPASPTFTTSGADFAIGGIAGKNRIESYSTGVPIRFLNTGNSYADIAVNDVYIGGTNTLTSLLSGKQATITGAASTVVSSNLSAWKAVATDGNGKLVDGPANYADLENISGSSGNFQTQIDGKANSSHSHGAISSLGRVSTSATTTTYDRILISDYSDSNAVKQGPSIGTSTTTFLRNDGSWSQPVGIVASVNGLTGDVSVSNLTTTYVTVGAQPASLVSGLLANHNTADKTVKVETGIFQSGGSSGNYVTFTAGFSLAPTVFAFVKSPSTTSTLATSKTTSVTYSGARFYTSYAASSGAQWADNTNIVYWIAIGR